MRAGEGLPELRDRRETRRAVRVAAQARGRPRQHAHPQDRRPPALGGAPDPRRARRGGGAGAGPHPLQAAAVHLGLYPIVTS
jgi:hypothetical protein